MLPLDLFLLLVLIAIGIGFLASLFGIGGGFLLVPTMIMYVGLSEHQTVATASFVIIFLALSSSIAYARQKRIDYKITAILMLASLVGSVIGALFTEFVSGQFIIIMFGIVESVLAIILGLKKTPNEKIQVTIVNEKSIEKSKNEDIKKSYYIERRIVDSDGKEYQYEANILLAFPLTFLAGFLSSLLGIGGGTLYIQIFVFLCGMSIHLAIASSIFTIFFSSIASAGTFALMGQIDYGVGFAYAIGMVVGAQLGALINKKIESKLLKKLAALMILIIAVRMIIFAVVDI
ncbi:MAG: sulfite exporter TauE/SafE family protein [archaeon]|nr:sulfite exporter TauE/SafE family protein [archaeon]